MKFISSQTGNFEVNFPEVTHTLSDKIVSCPQKPSDEAALELPGS
jgi:hypothetical protein